MKKILTSILLVLTLSSCVYAGDWKGLRFIRNNGVTVVGTCSEDGIDYSEDRVLSQFNMVDCNGPYNVYYVQSAESKVLVEGRKEDVEKLITNVSGSTLKIKLENGTYRSLVLRVTVFSPDVISVTKSGSGGYFDNKGHRTTSNISYSSSGSCHFTLGMIDCGRLEVSTSGSGRVQANMVKCDGASFRISGSGREELEKFASKSDVSFRISGSGNVNAEDLFVEGGLDLKISGSGRMSLNGEVTGVVNASTSGSGNISGNLKNGGLETSISGSGTIRFTR